jgi:hypothetical protein
MSLVALAPLETVFRSASNVNAASLPVGRNHGTIITQIANPG